MFRFEFQDTSSEKSSDNVALEFPDKGDEITIYELHRLCKLFAAVLGYHPDSIERAFGETVWDD